jgi:lipoyl(octanoyl) transferase
MTYKTDFQDLGSIDYKEAWDYQEKKLEEIVNMRENSSENKHNILIFCEHPHVFTLGKSGAENNLLINEEFLKKINATYYKTNRGGDITYHGPGQLVVYPLFDLKEMKIGIKDYVNKIEEVIIQTLLDYNIVAERLDGATGVWIDSKTHGKARKICAIGVRVSRFVTMHGLAFNVNTNLDYFNYINPCGYVDKGVTSLNKEIGMHVEMRILKEKVLENFIRIFGVYLSS